MTKEMTAYEMALFMQVVNVGMEEEDYLGEMTSVGSAIQQKIDEVIKEKEGVTQKDFLLSQAEMFKLGVERINELSEHLKGEHEHETFDA